MATTNCRLFQDGLEQWMEGQRSDSARAHVKSCRDCTALVADFDAIEREAHSWNTLPSEPPERIWVSLRNQLEAEGIIHDGVAQTQPAGKTSWWDTLLGKFPRPILAGGYLAALVALAVAMSGVGTQHPKTVNWVDNNGSVVSSPLRAQLNTAELAAFSSMRTPNSAVAASLHQNLTIVDNYIALCEKSVSEEPDNEVARDFLYDAYQQKADLLNDLSERGEIGQ